MGCNCGGNKNGAAVYEFTAPDGSKRVYTSEIEAQAAKIRAGGGSVQTVVKV
jgi:hypothetical protein